MGAPPTLTPSPAVSTVVLSLIARGPPSDYADTTELRALIAEKAGVQPEQVTIQVTAASESQQSSITATIVVPPSSSPSDVKASLDDALPSAEAATIALGIPVEAMPLIRLGDVDDGKSDSSLGAAIGISVAVIILLGLLGVGGFYLYKKHYQKVPRTSTKKYSNVSNVQHQVVIDMNVHKQLRPNQA